ncbi:TRAP transporter small permease [Thalassovita sp.]|uniref:TRAP transporter small permease n=1 Tax=Thalassovita sp. TaxID=1979401 RepID=UPI00288124C4|nr:TRAP transporter small permease [Thalassovita sp.]MDF1802137.1 TRAP transporter small permease [Thalassovita sp.]
MKLLHSFVGTATKLIGSAVLVLMALQIVIDVFMRNVLGAGFPATADLVSKYYMILVSFLPIAYAELQRRHVEASVFTDMMPKPTHRWIYLFGFVLSFVVYAMLAWGTMKEALVQTGRGAYVEAGTIVFYTWPGYWILPVSFALMTIVLGVRLVEVSRGAFADIPADQAQIAEPPNQMD